MVCSLSLLLVLCSQSGEGQTGARYFYAYNVPPLKHWNSQLEVVMEKNLGEPHDPLLDVELADGTRQQLNVKGLRHRDILAQLLALDPHAEKVTEGPGYRAPLYHDE